MDEEMKERDYLALSAVVDAPDGVLRFDNLGDIPTEAIDRLHGMGLVLTTYIGWRATPTGKAKLIAYRYPIDELALAPATERAETVGDVSGAGDVGSAFDLIERRIMKSGETRYLDGIDEPVGLETAKYINDQSMALLNSQKGAVAFYEMYQEAQAENEAKSTRIVALERALATANRLIDEIEQNMPTKQPEERSHSNGAKAYSAWIAGEKIRAYKARTASATAAGSDASGALAHVANEFVTLEMEVAEALGLDRHTFLDADGPDALIEHIEALRADYDLGVKQAATLQTELEAARDALEACINADLTGYWSPEEVAKRYFEAHPKAAE